MPKIKVTAKIGDTIHPKYGQLVKGDEYTIEEEEFGEEIFEKVETQNIASLQDGENTKKKGGK